MSNPSHELKNYYEELNQLDELFNELMLHKKMFVLKKNDKKNLEEIFDLIRNFKDIKMKLDEINIEKISMEEIENLIAKIAWLEKRTNVLYNDESIGRSLEIIINLEYILSLIIGKSEFVIGVKRNLKIETLGSNELATITDYHLFLDQDSFMKLILQLKNQFSLIDFDGSLLESDFDNWIIELGFILGSIHKELIFNALYLKNQYLLNQFILLNKKYSPEIKIISTLYGNSFFLPKFPDIITKLTALKDKISKSDKEELKIPKWDRLKYGLSDIDEMLSIFEENDLNS